MLEPALTAANLLIFAVCFAVGTAKAAAARADRDATLRITASVLLCASMVYLLSAPAVYRAVGTAVGSPSLPSLVVNIAILVCVGHAHALTLLWHPRRRTPEALRRAVVLWLPVYGLAIAAMSVLFWLADLPGPAFPLSFATSYAHVPAACAMEMVYLAALVTGVVATVRQCRGPDGVIALPGRPDLQDSLRLFQLAVGLDLAYVGCTATAVLAASQGYHTLDFLTAAGSTASSSSALVASYGLAKPALAARAVERADHDNLIPLWQTVTGSTEWPRLTWWNRYALVDILAEILDGTYRLTPWMSPAVAQAVDALVEPRSDKGDIDVASLKAAAQIRYARQRRDAAVQLRLPTPDASAGTPRSTTAPTHERARQVAIARHLDDPLVKEALATLDRVA